MVRTVAYASEQCKPAGATRCTSRATGTIVSDPPRWYCGYTIYQVAPGPPLAALRWEEAMICEICDTRTTASLSTEIGPWRVCDMCATTFREWLRKEVRSINGWLYMGADKEIRPRSTKKGR